MIRVVLDTNPRVGWLNRSLHPELFLGREYVRYLSSVVLMELRAGASTRRASTAVDQLLRGYRGGGRLVAPPAQLFDRAGTILRRLRGAAQSPQDFAPFSDPRRKHRISINPSRRPFERRREVVDVLT